MDAEETFWSPGVQCAIYEIRHPATTEHAKLHARRLVLVEAAKKSPKDKLALALFDGQYPQIARQAHVDGACWRASGSPDRLVTW